MAIILRHKGRQKSGECQAAKDVSRAQGHDHRKMKGRSKESKKNAETKLYSNTSAFFDIRRRIRFLQRGVVQYSFKRRLCTIKQRKNTRDCDEETQPSWYVN
jgi:hypothetical protein